MADMLQRSPIDDLAQIREAVRALCAGFPANTGARSTASAAIRPNSSRR